MYKQRLLQLFLTLIFAGLMPIDASVAASRKQLITNLFVNYDAAAIPVQNGDKMDVSVNIELQHFEYRVSDGAFHLVGSLDASWRDPKLAWNPASYGNLTRISINKGLVWIPDLEVYNNAPDKLFRMDRYGLVVLDNTGTVVWTDNIDVMIFCTTHMDNWPHDRHFCKMNLGSWTYHGFELDITNAAPNTSMTFNNLKMKNTQYRITNFTAEHVVTLYECCAEPYITIDYNITFERRAAFVVIFRMPALCVVILTLLSLCLEPWRSEKLWLNAVSFIIIVFNLIYFATRVGSLVRGTPYIVRFFSSSMILVTLNHLVTVFSLFATRSNFKGNLPAFCLRLLKSPLIQFIAPTTAIHHSAPRPSREHNEFNTQFEDVKLEGCSNLISFNSKPNEWIQIAVVLERIALIVFSVIFLILGTVYYV